MGFKEVDFGNTGWCSSGCSWGVPSTSVTPRWARAGDCRIICFGKCVSLLTPQRGLFLSCVSRMQSKQRVWRRLESEKVTMPTSRSAPGSSTDRSIMWRSLGIHHDEKTQSLAAVFYDLLMLCVYVELKSPAIKKARSNQYSVTYERQDRRASVVTVYRLSLFTFKYTPSKWIEMCFLMYAI